VQPSIDLASHRASRLRVSVVFAMHALLRVIERKMVSVLRVVTRSNNEELQVLEERCVTNWVCAQIWIFAPFAAWG